MKKIIALLLALVAATALATSRFKTDQVTDEDGGDVSFPAGAAFPSTGNVDLDATLNGDNLDSSSASLTVTAGSNAQSVTTPATFYYIKVGDIVHAFGDVSIDPTSDDTSTVFTLSLPVTRASNFSGTAQGGGVAAKIINEVGFCNSTNSAKTMTCTYYSNGTAAETVKVHFTYLDD